MQQTQCSPAASHQFFALPACVIPKPQQIHLEGCWCNLCPGLVPCSLGHPCCYITDCRLKASRSPTSCSERQSPSELRTVARSTEAAEGSNKAAAGNYLRLPIASSKADKHSLERQLPAALQFLSAHLLQEHRVLIHCDAGMYLCVP